ncbi:NAD-dependent epimerase/dehydratase family protein [Georgenia yuyongxinii]|uniref:NAD-dependent epimerase/dehydratase family protein n=1 Tax=Georgenia yuyongxinii TaxID=2589797 RepID=A0A5B8CAQ0_9MICO|nr:NAD-dependent epimerase/dehydratase family protein [Georgenia yuyongxinii]QDC26332.1 NAD-dependent epimerase/dehydratase family protein [Georgenia yuyongxinii]
MRVAVVGATGNVGTAVLRALAAEPAITSILGIARRLPDTGAHPYAAAEWVPMDIAPSTDDTVADDAVIDRLATALTGADAVIHLVWAIQPNHDREKMRRTNVEGTRRVAEACARAGVGQLVCASSWAAYSPVDDDVPRDESWATGGIPSSHYGVDKAAQERVLDELEAAHPELVVTRMRTALIFQADAGAQIARYFLGPWVPLAVLRPGALPVLPLPSHLRLHVVHADDAAQAYLQVVLQRARGAFNVAADEVLWPSDLARILDHGRGVEISPRLIRPLVHFAWRAKLLASDAGWLDMAMGVPVMDGSRVREVLGWRPRHDAEETLREMLGGIVRREGNPSPSMRPHDKQFRDAADIGGRHREHTIPGDVMAAHIPPHLDGRLLGLYLADHLAGATGGSNRIERMAKAYADTSMGPELASLAAEIVEAREALRSVIEALGLPQRPLRQAATWVGERVGRLKLNGRVVTRSPLTPVLELEIMRSAVNGQLGLWQTLTDLADDLALPRERFEELANGARGFDARLERLHETARATAFTVGTKVGAGS